MGSSTDGVEPRKEANLQAGQGCYFTWNKVKVCQEAEGASSLEIRCCCLRKNTCCHDLHVFLGYSKRILPQPLLKKSMYWNNRTPILPNSTDQLTLDPARENQAYCYLAEAPGERVYKTLECWGQDR